MATLTRANEELFRRKPDECFENLVDLWQHCHEQKERSIEHWPQPENIRPWASEGRLQLLCDGDRSFGLTEWSFSQLCSLARVSKETVNRLSPETARQVFTETLSGGSKPLQMYTLDERVRAIHGASYTRLYNVDLLTMVREFATDFVPPQAAGIGNTEPSVSDEDIPFAPDPEPRTPRGLYCGEQDMFCFLIDPTGWTEINGQAFAPGFFVWNSEVGRRSLGVQTFWFQAVCQNHIVWDAVEVVDFSRKHTANVYDAIREIRTILERLVEARDARRDGFVRVMRQAMATSLGDSSDDVLGLLKERGFTKALAKEALDIARRKGAFTVFAVVDALTQLAGKKRNAGERNEMDQKAASLLTLAV